MIKVNEALRIILGCIRPLGIEKVRLTNGQERVLAEDLYADSDIPGFDNSAMDGYALRSFDTKGASKDRPKVLEVIEDLKAGYVSKKILKDGQAIKIMTGASIPKGADSVIMVEYTKKVIGDRLWVIGKNPKPKTQHPKPEIIQLLREVKKGENIRKAGEDIKKGELVIKKGALLRPSHIGILASLGKSKIKVAKRPKAAILVTGDEVVDVDDKLTPGKLRSSNTYTLYSQIIGCGGTPKNLGIAKDEPIQLEKRIKKGLDCDLIVTSGGVSVGEYDFVKYVLAKMGTDIKFWQVAIRPGKPLVFGMLKGKPIFGLPGNPVSSMVSFEFFVRPAILKMLGQKEDDRKEVEAVLEEDITKKKGIRYFLRAKTIWSKGLYLTRGVGPQGSGILKSMVLANSLIILSEEEERLRRGKRVKVRFLY